MLVSEHASEKVERTPAQSISTVPDQDKAGKVDRRYLSNFWETTTGEGGRLDIIDYICPHCHQNIFREVWSATYCRKCNTPIFSAPRRKLDAKQFTNWYGREIEGMKYAGPTDRSKAIRKGHPGQRPGKTAKGHW